MIGLDNKFALQMNTGITEGYLFDDDPELWLVFTTKDGRRWVQDSDIEHWNEELMFLKHACKNPRRWYIVTQKGKAYSR